MCGSCRSSHTKLFFNAPDLTHTAGGRVAVSGDERLVSATHMKASRSPCVLLTTPMKALTKASAQSKRCRGLFLLYMRGKYVSNLLRLPISLDIRCSSLAACGENIVQSFAYLFRSIHVYIIVSCTEGDLKWLGTFAHSAAEHNTHLLEACIALRVVVFEYGRRLQGRLVPPGVVRKSYSPTFCCGQDPVLAIFAGIPHIQPPGTVESQCLWRKSCSDSRCRYCLLVLCIDVP